MFKKKLGIFALALMPLAIGLVVGLAIPVDFIRSKVASSLEDTQSTADDAHGTAATGGSSNSVDLTQTSQEGLGLLTGRIQYSDYRSSFDVPAFVREIPGASDLHVSSRFAGLVKRVFISEGQTVRPGQPILEVELTGDQLATAQSELLEAQKQISIVNQEIKRLEPSAQSGGVANKRLIETRYERDRLTARVETKTQELLVRGLNQEQVDQIIETKKLLRSVVVRVPEDLIPPQLNAGDMMSDAAESFLVEQLLAKPGAMTQLGENLCELSYHAVLVVEGQAYEKDLPQIRAAIAQKTPIDILIGPDGSEFFLQGHQIAFLSNHVDDATNTYPFFIYLKNEDLFASTSETSDYVTWKWKPGQRAHVEIPNKVFSKSVVIPREALAVDGLKNYVYRWAGIVECDHGHEDAADAAADEHEVADRFEAVEVIVTHRDRKLVVIEMGEKLQLGDRIAINNAGSLLFAMQSGSGGGGGHSHSH